MKAIIDSREIALEKAEGKWLPAGTTEVEVQRLGENKLFILVQGQTFTADLLSVNREDKVVEILLNGKKQSVKIKEPLDDLLHDMGLDNLSQKGASNVKAPMPGLVLDVTVSEGATVAKGDKILVLEAMKMENVIKSPGDGTVVRILVGKGETVEKNQILIEFA